MTKPDLPRFEVFRLHPTASLPRKMHQSDVGFDICAHLLSESGKPLHKALHQKGVTAIPTGLVVRPPPGYFVSCCSRSGMALQGVFVANSPGIIDPTYTGEIMVLLFNGSFETHYVTHGQRIAQLVLTPICPAAISELKERPKAVERGEAGLGSTGD